MKRIGLLVALTFVIALTMSSVSWGGLCLDSDTACNDFYFCFERLQTGPAIYELHGYEYGCGSDDQLANGSIFVTGGYAYCGFNTQGRTGSGDYGNTAQRVYVINLSTNKGDYTYTYFAVSGVSPIAWGGGPNAATLRKSCVPSLTGETGLEVDEKFAE